MRMRWLPGLVVLLAGCPGKEEGTPLPAPGEPEAVELLWEDAAFPGSHPSVVSFDGGWHMAITGKEGTFTACLGAVSEDGLSFTLASAHRIVDELVDESGDSVSSCVLYASSTRMHALANASLGGSAELWHATSTDGSSFTLDAAAISTEGASGGILEATGALYEAGEVLGAFRRTPSGEEPEEGVYLSRSTDGGESFPAAGLGLSPDDIPSPWGSTTVGAGGMWGASIAGDPEGGYHMLFLGAAPNGDEALGIGQAWSGDGEIWTTDGALWYEPEAGMTLNGLSLVEADGGWWVWVGMAPEGEDPLQTGAVYRLRVE